jgi:nucleotide-binding universal stress UspA family protein
LLEKLLLAVDDSAHSRKAVPAVAELARAGGGTVHVLHVREVYYPLPPTVTGDRPEEARRLVEEIVAELEQAGVKTEGTVRPSTGGSPAGPSSSTPASSGRAWSWSAPRAGPAWAACSWAASPTR